MALPFSGRCRRRPGRVLGGKSEHSECSRGGHFLLLKLVFIWKHNTMYLNNSKINVNKMHSEFNFINVHIHLGNEI